MARATWHEQHRNNFTLGQRVADGTARALGSWPFIIGQTAFVVAWMALNVIGWANHWDPYPFILLNLMFSIQAAYSAPVIMMSQNRAAERDRYQAKADYETNVRSEHIAEQVLDKLDHMENEQLARVLELLERMSSDEPETAGADSSPSPEGAPDAGA